jgi:hypothetical protein
MTAEIEKPEVVPQKSYKAPKPVIPAKYSKKDPNYAEMVLKTGIISNLETLESTLERSINSIDVIEEPTNLSPIFLPSDLKVKYGNLEVINPDDLSAIEFVSYRYFIRQLEVLARTFKLDKTQVVISSQLPSDEQGNNSFMPKFYIFDENIIIIPEMHLKSVGLLSTICCHISSHLV